LSSRAALRRRVDAVIDEVRLRLDTFPHGLYQPVDGLGGRVVTRGEGSRSRWAAMRPILEANGVRTAMDVGANAGYFPIELARAGIRAVAVDFEPTEVRTMLTATRRNEVSDRVAVMALRIEPDSVEVLPSVDAVLCLSLWHHLVRAHGLDAADGILAALWERSRKVLIFDTGEREMGPDFGLPAMEPDARTWLAGHLAAVCAGGTVEHLGTHAAFGPDGAPVTRNLFAVIRSG
jgi:SAM-dependent methyltransferase